MRVALLLVVLVAVAAAAGWAGWQLTRPLVVADNEPVLLVDVRPGDSVGAVLRRLAGAQQLPDSRALRAWARLRLHGRALHVGIYEIPAGTPGWQVVETLLSGKVQQRSFTLVEGWSMRQLRAALAAESLLQQELPALDDSAVSKAIGIPTDSPEGWFAPDTYFYTPLAGSDLDLLRRAFGAQQARLDEAWANREGNLPYATPYEMLTMASIVEKETGAPAERPDIAGVFVRRLRIGMRLQTDPTVIYGLGDAYRGNITRAHLLQPTPWNTYQIDGLPPTPIAMPGRAAIEAAAHPAPGKALYFVARGDGSHRFSATLEEHNAAVREFQLRRRSDYRSAPGASAR
jgi:UPF0755 protein